MATAMVWGASGGIGRTLVQALVDEGWQVIAVARQADELTTITPHVFDADISSPYEVEVAVCTAGRIVGAVDLWVYSVGDILSAKVEQLAPDTWQRLIDANLTGAFTTTHYSLPLLAENAHLVYVGAITERLRLPGLSAYVAAKSGLEAYAEALRKEERKRRVTVLRPAAVETPFWEKVRMRLPKQALTADDVAKRILTIYGEGEEGIIDLTTTG